MAESFDDGEFWLPPQFLSDDDIFMDNHSNNKKKNNSENTNLKSITKDANAKSFFPFEFPYEFGSFGVSSDLSSPGESVVGSAEESDEEDYIAGITCQMAVSSLEDKFRANDLLFQKETTEGWVVSGSPQSTLCGVGSGCGCRQGSSRGSPNGSSKVSSPPPTWDLLYAAAGEVARMRMNEEGYGFNSHNRGILGPPRKPSPVSVPVENSNHDIGLYPEQSLSYQKLQESQFLQLRQQQMMKQQSSSVWGGQNKGAGLYPLQQTQPVVQSRGRNFCRPMGLSPSAWPSLQQAQQQQHQGRSGMRAVFLSNPGGKRECAGTGVFLPQRIGTHNETRKKPACSAVLVPARVVQALNLNLEDIGSQPQYQPRFNRNMNSVRENAMRLRNRSLVTYQRLNARPQPESELRLPQDWTY